ncbi:MAG: HAD family hydrolase [Planctomycetota bacterium]|nr:MAG: HAD family hydrolase [Planctomycetota bacterium]
MITTVIFDMDDTLYDEVDFCRSGFAAVAAFLANVPNLTAWPTETEIRDAFGAQFDAGNRTSVFNAALDELGVAYTPETIKHLVGVYREHTPEITLPAESKDVLELLSGQYVLALLTDGFLPTQRLKAGALGLERYFQAIIYTEELGRECWKPSTKGFKHLLKQLHEKPANCVYVADNAKKDFIGPKQLGMNTIQLIRPNRIHNTPPSDADAAPDQIIASITQLPQALKRIGQP